MFVLDFTTSVNVSANDCVCVLACDRRATCPGVPASRLWEKLQRPHDPEQDAQTKTAAEN